MIVVERRLGLRVNKCIGIEAPLVEVFAEAHVVVEADCLPKSLGFNGLLNRFELTELHVHR